MLPVWLGFVTSVLAGGGGGGRGGGGGGQAAIVFCFKISGFVCVTNTAGNSHRGLFQTCAFGATEAATHVPGLLGRLHWLHWSPAAVSVSCTAALSGRDGITSAAKLRSRTFPKIWALNSTDWATAPELCGAF